MFVFLLSMLTSYMIVRDIKKSYQKKNSIKQTEVSKKEIKFQTK